MTDTPPVQAPSSGVIVHPKVLFLAFLLLLFKPKLCVDGGEPMNLIWGENFVPLPAGHHTLRCYVPYLIYRHLGDSTIEVDVTPGGSPKFQWRTPWLVFLKGKWKFITSG
jgi:hypothetical protein